MKRSRILFLISPVLAWIGTLLLLIAYGTAFDPTVSHYFSAKPLPVIAAILLALSIACGIAGAIFAKKEPDSLASPRVPSFALLPAALGALASAVWLLIAGQALLGIFTLLAAAFFALGASPLAKRYGNYLLFGGFAVIAATIIYNATFYFDMTVEMNAPTKILLQMAFLSAMLFATAECRVLMGRFDRLLVPALTIFCLSLCTCAGIADFYLLFAKKGPGTAYLTAAPLLLGFGLTACLRLAEMLFCKEETPTPDGACADEESESEEDGE